MQNQPVKASPCPVTSFRLSAGNPAQDRELVARCGCLDLRLTYYVNWPIMVVFLTCTTLLLRSCSATVPRCSQGVKCIVHYQIPAAVDVYVHRCGRTARASAEGISVAMVAAKEMPRFSALLKVSAGATMHLCNRGAESLC